MVVYLLDCTNCGSAQSNQTQFCTNCGWRTSGTANQSPSKVATTYEAPNSNVTTSNSRNMLYFTIMVVAVSISAVVLTIFFTRSDSTKASNTTEATPALTPQTETSESAPAIEPEISNYVAEMNLLLAEYSTSRTALSKFVSRIDANEDVSVSDAALFFDEATSQRQGILDQMNSLSPPTNLVSKHEEIVSVILRAITAMNSANIGIAACDYGIGDCDISAIPAWQEFRSESKKITPIYNSALSAWKKAAGVS